jgi:hypothetical protein
MATSVACRQIARTSAMAAPSGQGAVADAVVQLIVSLVHERARRPQLLVGLSDEAVHHLALVPWTKADLLFLASALSRGISLVEAAGFLGRTEEEARRQGALITAARHRQNRR